MRALEVNKLSKSYGTVQALKEISFEVMPGELFGLIGADGAGKTTLFRLLTTLLLPDSGTALVDGLDMVRDYKQIRRQVGYMPGRFSLYGDLTVEENLQFFASVFGTTPGKNRFLIDDIYRQIEPFRTRRAVRLSGGMKQKLALCCALIHAPSVLFLDEPTTGVDPVSRKEFWQMLQRLRERGIAILVSTPYMDEARQCNRMAFIREGELLGTNTPQQMITSFGEALYAVSGTPMHSLLEEVRSYPGIKSCYPFGQTHHFTVCGREFSIPALDRHLVGKGYREITIEPIEATIEDCYLKLSEK